MNTQLQQLQAEGRMDTDAYRIYTLYTVLAKLVLALVFGILVICTLMMP